jgi:hypothetical protein
MAEHTASIFPLPALPQAIHDEVRREIARMNTAISQATQNSSIKVSLTWRPNSRFAQQLSERILDHVDGDGSTTAPAALSFGAEKADVDKSVVDLEKYVTQTVERLERALAAFKAAAAQI